MGHIHIAHVFINNGIFIGFCVGAMVLLRPLFCRVFTAQQRIVLWVFCITTNYNLFFIRCGGYRVLCPIFRLPIFLRDLITSQTWKDLGANFCEPYYFDLSGVPYLDTIYAVTLCLILLWVFCHSGPSKKLKRLGVEIPKDDPYFQSTGADLDWVNHIYVVEGLPTSFVEGDNIFLQKLPPSQRRDQIFLHETEHIRMRHSAIKGFFTLLCVCHWWNPLIWLGFRYMVRDLELACDSAVLSKLEPEGRTEYAKTLVELGCGRQLWTEPLCFGECDTEIRVKAALKWRPQRKRQKYARYMLMAVVIWFFIG